MTLPHGDVYLVGILMSVGTALIMSIKGLASKSSNRLVGWFKRKLVYSVKIYQYDELFYVLERWLFVNHEQQYKDVEASVDFGDFQQFEGPPSVSGSEGTNNQSQRKVNYKQEDTTFAISHKGKKFLISKESEKNDKTSSAKERFFRKYYITGWRCKAQVNDFLEGIFAEHEAARPRQLVKIKIASSYGELYTFDDLRVKSLDKVMLPGNMQQVIINDLKQFSEGEDWYKQVGICYKRGYCLYGPPGNGKTTLSLSIAAHLQRDINLLNISALDDDSALQRLFYNLAPRSILLIEDIDKAFAQRESKASKVSFSALLNTLDGALSKHGLIVIITTNHIEQLDPALLRDGRMDMKLEINNPDNRKISDYLSIFYQTPAVLSLQEENKDLCMAAIQEICVRNRNNPQGAISEITSRIIGNNLEVKE